MVDAADSKSAAGDSVRVRVSPPALIPKKSPSNQILGLFLCPKFLLSYNKQLYKQVDQTTNSGGFIEQSLYLLLYSAC